MNSHSISNDFLIFHDFSKDFQKRLLYEGDQIRVDEVSKALLLESIKSLREIMKQPREIIFYRWGNLDFYGRESLDELVDEW